MTAENDDTKMWHIAGRTSERSYRNLPPNSISRKHQACLDKIGIAATARILA
jgi:hypothetical protein